MDHASNSFFPEIFPVASHTDQVGPGSMFVAIQGFKDNGVRYIPQALERGATEIVVQQEAVIAPDIQFLIDQKLATFKRVANTRKALAELSAQAAGYPAQKLTIIGVTGTKGKTTTCFLLKHILSGAGYRTALLSTVGNQIDDDILPAPLTTAQPDYLHQFLKVCVDRGITHVVMEVAAQAVSLYRVYGIVFDAIVFTNFGLEHLEFYDTMESYFDAKCQLLNQRSATARAYINGDDTWCAPLAKAHERVAIFGFASHTNGYASMNFACPALSGTYNSYNVASAVSVALDMGITPDTINNALACFTGVPGRFEKHYLSNGALAIIDYAHNPLSYQALLPELRKRTKQLIVLFGAGGERDASRRPIMGSIAAEYADYVVLTNDNPRSEDPHKIVEDIGAGIPEQLKHKVIIELDRERAIQKAFSLSDKETIIALLGKGPDRYQIIGSTKTVFDEAAILAKL